MTQTIRTKNDERSVWIESDLGQGRRGKARLVSWCKITIKEYLDRTDLEGLDEQKAEIVKEELMCFNNPNPSVSNKSWAWEACDEDGETAIFKSEKEARDWAYSRNC